MDRELRKLLYTGIMEDELIDMLGNFGDIGRYFPLLFTNK